MKFPVNFRFNSLGKVSKGTIRAVGQETKDDVRSALIRLGVVHEDDKVKVILGENSHQFVVH